MKDTSRAAREVAKAPTHGRTAATIEENGQTESKTASEPTNGATVKCTPANTKMANNTVSAFYANLTEKYTREYGATAEEWEKAYF